ncbi:hypothetical protein R6Q59_007792 [Mikania micrantha]
MCICLKDHLNAIDRIQNITNLEDEIELETRVHEEEVEEGLSPDISDEELAQEARIRKRFANGLTTTMVWRRWELDRLRESFPPFPSPHDRIGVVMGYVLRVRFASFFAGAAVASAGGFYFLHKDYKIAHQSMSQQMNDLYKSLDGRITSLENLKEVETMKPVEDAE